MALWKDIEGFIAADIVVPFQNDFRFRRSGHPHPEKGPVKADSGQSQNGFTFRHLEKFFDILFEFFLNFFLPRGSAFVWPFDFDDQKWVKRVLKVGDCVIRPAVTTNRKVSADLVFFRREPCTQYVGVDRIKWVLQCIRAEGHQMYCLVYDMIVVRRYESVYETMKMVKIKVPMSATKIVNRKGVIRSTTRRKRAFFGDNKHTIGLRGTYLSASLQYRRQVGIHHRVDLCLAYKSQTHLACRRTEIKSA